LPDRSSRYLLDNTVFIAAVKRKWTKSTQLIYHLLDSPAELFANELLIFEYEKYARALGTSELLNYMKKSVIQVNPSQEEIDACAPFFPESEIADIEVQGYCSAFVLNGVFLKLMMSEIVDKFRVKAGAANNLFKQRPGIISELFDVWEEIDIINNINITLLDGQIFP
jgi:hypothetical protein